MDWRNILERAAWTFVQAFIGALGVDQAGWLSVTGAQAAAIAGVAAVLSLVKNVAQERLGR